MISVRVSRPRETRNLTTPRGRKGGGRKGRIRAQRTFPAPFGRLGPSSVDARELAMDGPLQRPCRGLKVGGADHHSDGAHGANGWFVDPADPFQRQRDCPQPHTPRRPARAL